MTSSFLFSAFLSALFSSEYLIQPLYLRHIRDRLSGRLLLAIIFGLLAFSLTGQWRVWAIAPGAVLLYAAAAFWPTRSLRQWLSKELFRFAVLGGAAVLIANVCDIHFSLAAFRILIICSGVLFTVFWIAELVGMAARELSMKNGLTLHGLENGGLWIGRLERLLIFLFIFINAPAGIGFLVAAKSILRFSETKEDQRMAEYVLIGTLMSFALAIAAALLTQKCLAFLPAL